MNNWNWWMVWLGVAAGIFVSYNFHPGDYKDWWIFAAGGFTVYHLMEFNKDA